MNDPTTSWMVFCFKYIERVSILCISLMHSSYSSFFVLLFMIIYRFSASFFFILFIRIGFLIPERGHFNFLCISGYCKKMARASSLIGLTLCHRIRLNWASIAVVLNNLQTLWRKGLLDVCFQFSLFPNGIILDPFSSFCICTYSKCTSIYVKVFY